MKKFLFLLAFSLNAVALVDSNVGSEFAVFHQPGQQFTNQGYASLITGEQLFQSGIVVKEKAGYERFLDGAGGEHQGLRTQVSGMYPVNRTFEINGSAGYRTLGRGWGDYELGVGVDSKEEGFEWATGFERTFVMDSYVAYAGSAQARAHDFLAHMTWNQETLRYRLHPKFGWITSSNNSSNFNGGLKGSAELLMFQQDEFDLDLIYEAGFQHFEEDQSSLMPSKLEPGGGGYFSPRLFVEQVPHMRVKYRPQNRMELSLALGPSLQYVKEFQKTATFEVGTYATFGFDFRMNPRSALKIEMNYSSLANRFGRFQSLLGLSYAI